MATFKESSPKRPWFQRLTPVAWVLIAVIALSCLALTLLGCGWIIPQLAPTDEWATETPTPVPAVTSEPTPVPMNEVTDWWEPTEPPDVEETEVVIAEPFPAWWADEMTQDEDGHWWPPDEVVEMVKEHRSEFWDTWETYASDTKPPDLDGFEDVLPMFASGESLQDELDFLDSIRTGVNEATTCEWDLWLVTAQDFSPDGLECTLSEAAQDGLCSIHDRETGEVTEVYELPHSGMGLYRMRYDAIDGRWKADARTGYVPPPE
jgi:hypothetical protein